jgi:ribonuclease G
MRELATTVDAEAILIQMNPRVSQEFTGHDARVLRAIEADTGKWFHFEGSEGLPLEHFAVLMEADREQVLERALPFREGEEVYLEIIEPHMYSAGAAVAKVDGYIISVKDADGAVGQKRLVRIEEVGRTQAVAVLIDQPPIKATEAAPVAGSSAAKQPARKPRAATTSTTTTTGTAAPRTRSRRAAQPVDGATTAAAAAEQAAAPVEEDAVAPVEEAVAPPKPAAKPRTRAARPRASVAKPSDDAVKPSEDAAENPRAEAKPEAAAKVSEPSVGDDAAGNDADTVESTVRRRGRRGGRRRSTAKAGAAVAAEESSSE